MDNKFPSNASLWLSNGDQGLVQVLDQRVLPFETRIFEISTLEQACYAIREMVVRGAPLIGVTAAYGMYLAALNSDGPDREITMLQAEIALNATRPTAVNLFRMTGRMAAVYKQNKGKEDVVSDLLLEANRIRNEEIEACRLIGEYGLPLIREIGSRKKGQPVQILTHCNAGWLACVEWGTATAPIYLAHRMGIPIHVWVDETRPRNQGARLTAYELGLVGVPHTIIPDNAGGHLMQKGMVDMVITGSDRTTRNGDVANKIGTYLKAVAASDNGIPFYVALPSSTFDLDLVNGLDSIPVEERDASEVSFAEGWNGESISSVRIIPEKSPVANYGFDITPARLVTMLITEKGLCKPEEVSIVALINTKNE
ncbi:methylthioribose-1-phosphate isomerase [Bacteroidales bacterium 6E]|nr:methylthioribose-1-phosphate isomerase [Bacteroidales bacterium 6E]